MIYKIIRHIIFFAVFSVIFIIPINAYSPDETIHQMRKYIPDDIIEYIPDELFEGEGAYIESPEELLTSAAEILITLMAPALKLFATIMGTVIIASVYAMFREGITSQFASAFDFICTAGCALCIYTGLGGVWENAAAALQSLNLYINSMMAVMGALYAAGGAAASAAVSVASMTAVNALLENIIAIWLFPVLRICFSFSVAACIGGIDLSGISNLIKNTLMTVFGFILALMTFLITYQTHLAAAADTVAARTIKFAASSFVPIVGGTVGEAVRTVMGGLSYVKSAAGTIAVIVILFIVLPPLLQMFLSKIVLAASGAIAKLLGCQNIAGFISEMAGLINITLALVMSSSLVFILNISLFIKSGTAV